MPTRASENPSDSRGDSLVLSRHADKQLRLRCRRLRQRLPYRQLAALNAPNSTRRCERRRQPLTLQPQPTSRPSPLQPRRQCRLPYQQPNRSGRRQARRLRAQPPTPPQSHLCVGCGKRPAAAAARAKVCKRLEGGVRGCLWDMSRRCRGRVLDTSPPSPCRVCARAHALRRRSPRVTSVTSGHLGSPRVISGELAFSSTVVTSLEMMTAMMRP